MSRAIRLKLQLPWHVRAWRFFVCILFTLLALVVFVAGCYWFFTLPRFALSSVTILGTTNVERSLLHQKIFAYLATPRIGIVPRNSIFTLEKDEMAAALLTSFPRLKTVDARWGGKTDLTVTFADRTPQYLWTGAVGNFLADENSYVFAHASSTETAVELFKLSGGLVGEPIGKTVLTRDMLTWITLLRGDVVPLGVTLTGATIESEEDVTFSTNATWALKTNTSIDAQAIARSLSAVLRAQRDHGGLTRSIEYIDLRFPNKAYFRLRDGPVASSTLTHV